MKLHKNRGRNRFKQIAFEEFFNYFSRNKDYILCINHLDELKWLKKKEVENQFEFFPLEKKFAQKIRNKFYKKNFYLLKFPEDENEIRQKIRNFLKIKYENSSHDLNRTSDDEVFLRLQKIKFYLNEEFLTNFSLKNRFFILTASVLILLLGFLIFSLTGKKAHLLVSTGEIEAQVYLDSLYIGKSNNVLSIDEEGWHILKVVESHFIAIPEKIKIFLKKDSLTKVDVRLIPISKQNFGYLKIKANIDEASVYMDDHYYGNLKDEHTMRLIPGEHKIQLKKPYYNIDPPFQFVQIAPNETTEVEFHFIVPVSKNIILPETQTTTSIEISANVPGAHILINGKETGYTTDHIFTDLPYGTYRIQLKRRGYEFQPHEQVITLNKDNSIQSISFVGKKLLNKAIIRVHPPQAKLIIDRKIEALGTYEGELLIGEHELAIEVPEGYASFSPIRFEVSPSIPFEKELWLIPEFEYYLRISNNGNIEKKDMNYKSGFLEEVRGFKFSTDVGPEVVFNKIFNTYVWKFGFAFAYRNPQGEDAVQIIFTNKFDLKQLNNVKLIIKAGVTGEKYPLQITPFASWRVVFNNFKLHDLQDINSAQPNKLIKYSWDITQLIKYGPNVLEISPAENNNMFLFIKEIRITNKQ